MPTHTPVGEQRSQPPATLPGGQRRRPFTAQSRQTCNSKGVETQSRFTSALWCRKVWGGTRRSPKNDPRRGVGCRTLTFFTFHKTLKVRNQPHLPSRAWLRRGWSEVPEGGGHRMLEAHSPCRKRLALEGRHGILGGPPGPENMPAAHRGYGPGPGVQAWPWSGRGRKLAGETCLVLEAVAALPGNVPTFRPTASETQGWAQPLGFEQAPRGF